MHLASAAFYSSMKDLMLRLTKASHTVHQPHKHNCRSEDLKTELNRIVDEVMQ